MILRRENKTSRVALRERSREACSAPGVFAELWEHEAQNNSSCLFAAQIITGEYFGRGCRTVINHSAGTYIMTETGRGDVLL